MDSVDATASGKPYMVLKVDGHDPHSLNEFANETTFTIDNDGAESTVVGAGANHDEGVRFHQKAAGQGKDVRVWQIKQINDDTFVAESVPSF